MKTLLIDADGLLLNASIKAQKSIDWGDEVYTIVADLETAKHNLDAQLHAISKAGDSYDFVLCFSDSSRKYFRHEVYPEYKSNRKKGGERPLALKALRTWVEASYKCIEWPELEADDVLGILGTDPEYRASIIVSVDKDLLQIPGEHLDPMNLDKGVFEVLDVEAERMLWYQVLCGDSVDGYPGCPKVGPVTANRILDKAEEDEVIYEEAVAEAFTKNKSSVEAMVTQYNVARILKYTDYKDGKVLYYER